MIDERTRYVFLEGAIKALGRLGWRHIERPKAHAFARNLEGRTHIIVLPRREAVPAELIIERLSRTQGILVTDFFEEYKAVYNGEPPLMPM